MDKPLSEMKMINKYSRTIRKKDLNMGMEYTITGMKYVKTKCGNKLDITIHYERKWSICLPLSVLIPKQLILKKIEKKT